MAEWQEESVCVCMGVCVCGCVRLRERETEGDAQWHEWEAIHTTMETKNTSVHVRHVKEDTSWHLMPGKKVHTTSLCKQILAFLNIAYPTIMFSSQTLAAILLNTEH